MNEYLPLNSDGDSLSTYRELARNETDQTSLLVEELERLGKRVIDDDGFAYYQVDDPETVLNWATINGFILHGTTQKVDEFEPRKANDTAKESGNRTAIYMGDNALISMFMALKGGTELPGHSSFGVHSKSQLGQLPSKDYLFTVDSEDKIMPEGYVYIFDRSQSDEYVNNEYLSYTPQRPIAVIRIKRPDFRHNIEIMSQEEAEKNNPGLKN